MKLNEYELKRLKKERMEEIDKWLDNEYGCSYTKLEELHNYWLEKSTNQKLEIKRLKSNEKTLADLLDKEQKKNKKAIEYLNQPYRDNFDYSRAELLDILEGEDKE